MSMTDSIADMLTRIRNGQKSRLLSVDLPTSKFKCAVLDVLKYEGYIAGYILIEGEGNKKNKQDEGDKVSVQLKYSSSGKPAICEIHKVSKPGKRIYSPIAELKGYFNNMGIYVLSTSKGVMSDRNAKKHNVGGEVICKVF